MNPKRTAQTIKQYYVDFFQTLEKRSISRFFLKPRSALFSLSISLYKAPKEKSIKDEDILYDSPIFYNEIYHRYLVPENESDVIEFLKVGVRSVFNSYRDFLYQEYKTPEDVIVKPILVSQKVFFNVPGTIMYEMRETKNTPPNPLDLTLLIEDKLLEESGEIHSTLLLKFSPIGTQSSLLLEVSFPVITEDVF